LAKIAVEPASPSAAPPAGKLLAEGDGWTVFDVVCTAGPRDRPFEERHARASIAIVVSGTFQYRSAAGRELMTPGSLFLGNHGQCFECGHEHGTGDRCVSFSYAPEFFERLASDAGGGEPFRHLRLPPIRPLAPIVSRAAAALAGPADRPWEELAVEIAAQAVQLDRGLSPRTSTAGAGAEARVTQAVRRMERHPEDSYPLEILAREARLSPYHFLRTFEARTGATPHQYLLRLRLRCAALRLSAESTKIVDIALDCGFGDVSNFTRTFRAEFGVSPRAYRVRGADCQSAAGC
jgi:AraC-like DNA-binding protein